MQWNRNSFSSTGLFKILFLIVFWGMWIGFPLLVSFDNEGLKAFMMQMIPVNLALIPLFFINSELLIGRLLPKKGIGYYFAVLVVTIVVFVFIHLYLKQILLSRPSSVGGRSGQWLQSFFPTITVAAVSTGYGFISFFIKRQKLEKEEKEVRKQSELSFLRSQISPHFIFNVLNSIVYLIRSKSPRAEEVTIQLSEIMQYMLYNTKEQSVLLEREITYLQNYIDLQKIRFEEDVKIDFTLTGDVSNQMIEPMLMIPFVENAFKHGTGTVMDPYIGIIIKIEDGTFNLEVKNKFNLGQDTKSDKNGIGLVNVKRRLELLYPDRHELVISQTDEWFSILLSLKLSN